MGRLEDVVVPDVASHVALLVRRLAALPLLSPFYLRAFSAICRSFWDFSIVIAASLVRDMTDG